MTPAIAPRRDAPSTVLAAFVQLADAALATHGIPAAADTTYEYGFVVGVQALVPPKPVSLPMENHPGWLEVAARLDAALAPFIPDWIRLSRVDTDLAIPDFSALADSISDALLAHGAATHAGAAEAYPCVFLAFDETAAGIDASLFAPPCVPDLPVAARAACMLEIDRLIQAFVRRHPLWFSRVCGDGELGLRSLSSLSAHEELDALRRHRQRMAAEGSAPPTVPA